MNIKPVVNLEIEMESNVYVFSMPVGASWGEAYNACFQSLQKVMELSNQALESTRPKESASIDSEQ